MMSRDYNWEARGPLAQGGFCCPPACLPPPPGRFIPEGLQCSCGPDWYTTNNKWNNESYVLFLFCFCFGLPLATIIFSYGRLLLTLRAVSPLGDPPVQPGIMG